MNDDELSELARKAINILFVSNARGTSIGILIGVVLDGLIGLFSPILKAIEWLSISSIKIWHLIGLGVVCMNLPSYLMRKKIDPSIENAITFIEDEKAKGNIADWQAKQMYTNLHQKVLDNVAIEVTRQDEKGTIKAGTERTDKTND